MSVNDELLFEVPLAEEKALEALVSREMEAAMSLRVPLIVQGGFGRTWYDTKV